MSTNCVRCVRRPRNPNKPGSLLCLQCEAEEWDKIVERTIAQYPPLASFLDTYQSHCGAPKAVFQGQTVRMLTDVLQLAVKQMGGEERDSATVSDIISAIPLNLEEDMLMAFRFAYYCKAAPLIPDALYDEAEKEFINRPEVEDSPLMNPGSDNEADYPRRVKALWLYLFAAREDRRPADCPVAAPTAPPAPRKAPKRAKTAEKPPEAAQSSLF